MNWYAIYVRSRTEKKVNEALNKLGIENYLPLITEVRQWSDRKKKVTLPAISCYVFVRIDMKTDKLTVLNCDNVVGFVSERRTPHAIADREIEMMKKALSDNEAIVTFETKQLVVGEKVIIEGGIMEGYEGVVIESVGKKKYLISLENAGFDMILEYRV